jgi:hypothetical protein
VFDDTGVEGQDPHFIRGVRATLLVDAIIGQILDLFIEVEWWTQRRQKSKTLTIFRRHIMDFLPFSTEYLQHKGA